MDVSCEGLTGSLWGRILNLVSLLYRVYIKYARDPVEFKGHGS